MGDQTAKCYLLLTTESHLCPESSWLRTTTTNLRPLLLLKTYLPFYEQMIQVLEKLSLLPLFVCDVIDPFRNGS